MVRDEQRDGGVLVGHAVVRQVARELELVGGELRLGARRGVVLLDDGPARLDVGEERGKLRDKVRPGAEGAHADDHGVEALELLRGQVGARQRGDRVPHLLQARGGAVAGARQVADRSAADIQVQADGLQARGRLEQLGWDVAVA